MEFICFIHHCDTAYPAKIINVFKNAHGDDLHGDWEGKFGFYYLIYEHNKKAHPLANG